MLSLLWEFALGLPDAKIDEDRANPARGRRLHKVKNPHLPWPPQVQRQFLEGASDRLRLAYTLARHTGFRRGDICSIKWRDYDEKAEVLYVQATEKTRAYVPMHVEPELAELLAKTPRVHQCILTSSLGEPYTKRALTGLFTQRLRKIGAEGYTLHGLRKTLAVELAEAGAAPQAIMHTLGHKTVKQAMEYCERANKAPMIKGAFAARRKNRAVA
jgi:integrase